MTITARRPDLDEPVILTGALLRVPTSMVEPGPNARSNLGDLRELAKSLKHLGQEKPLLVHQIAATGPVRYRLLDGHRRHAAAKLAGLPTVDVILRRDRGAAARLQQQLALHANNEPFNPMDEANACHELMFQHGLTREQIAARVGRSPLWVRDRIALVHLTDTEQDKVASGELGIGQALHILAERRAGHTAPERRKAKARVVKHCRTCRCGDHPAPGQRA